MKKYIVYYATEENAYEIDNFKRNDLKDALDTMQGLIGEIGGEFDRNACEQAVNANGYDYEEMENPQGYNVVVGIAEEGNDEIEDLLCDYRTEIIEMF